MNIHSDQDHLDQSLTQFLRQHRPVAPLGHPDLEQQILAQLTLLPPPARPWQKHWQKTLGLTALVITAAAATWITSDRAKFQPSLAQISVQEKQELTNSLVRNWLVSSGEDPEEAIGSFNF
ncbi:MAG: hypothetical protein SFT94_05705 [Pseudanabaenaceae cyanobacterium bins.68]|nr:hypothetical protein [Pseudanabaenaceae cyanobacterium bins.68]